MPEPIHPATRIAPLTVYTDAQGDASEYATRVWAVVEAAKAWLESLAGLMDDTTPEEDALADALNALDLVVECCDMHNQHCEPPSELCCGDCTEATHAGLFPHSDGSQCVLAPASVPSVRAQEATDV